MKGKNYKCITIWWGLSSCVNSTPHSTWVLEAPFCIVPASACPPFLQGSYYSDYFFCHRSVLPFLELYVKGNTKLAFFSLRLPSLTVMLLRFTHAMFIVSFLLLSIVSLYENATIFLCIFFPVWRILSYCHFWMLTIKPLCTFCAYFFVDINYFKEVPKREIAGAHRVGLCLKFNCIKKIFHFYKYFLLFLSLLTCCMSKLDIAGSLFCERMWK